VSVSLGDPTQPTTRQTDYTLVCEAPSTPTNGGRPKEGRVQDASRTPRCTKESAILSCMTGRRVRMASLVVLVTLAAISVGQGIRNALLSSQDFQWSPTRAFIQQRDPYREYLNASPDIILSQVPNYLHGLYLALTPLGILDFGPAKLIWAVLNVGFATTAALALCRTARLSRFMSAMIIAIFLAATPTRIAIGNGQQTLLVLLAATIAFSASRPAIAGVSLCLSLVKYSFFPLSLWFLARRRYAVLIFAAIATGLAAIVFSIRTDVPLSLAFVEPFLVSRVGTSQGTADIMSVTDLVLGGIGSPVSYLAAISVLAVTAGLFWRDSRFRDPLFGFSVLGIISLIAFKHLDYDQAFLLPLAVIAFGYRARMRTRLVLGGGLVYFWFGAKILNSLGISLGGLVPTLIQFSILFGLLIVLKRSVSLPSLAGVGGQLTTESPSGSEPTGFE